MLREDTCCHFLHFFVSRLIAECMLAAIDLPMAPCYAPADMLPGLGFVNDHQGEKHENIGRARKMFLLLAREASTSRKYATRQRRRMLMAPRRPAVVVGDVMLRAIRVGLLARDWREEVNLFAGCAGREAVTTSATWRRASFDATRCACHFTPRDALFDAFRPR